MPHTPDNRADISGALADHIARTHHTDAVVAERTARYMVDRYDIEVDPDEDLSAFDTLIAEVLG